MTVFWKYKNITTGNELESDNLYFLLHQLREVKGLQLPQNVDIDMLLKGQSNYSVEDKEGNRFEITIGECRTEEPFKTTV